MSKIAKEQESVTVQDLRKLSFFMGEEEVVKTLNMYYCTENGKIKGELQISQSRIFFEPQDCAENESHGSKN